MPSLLPGALTGRMSSTYAAPDGHVPSWLGQNRLVSTGDRALPWYKRRPRFMGPVRGQAYCSSGDELRHQQAQFNVRN